VKFERYMQEEKTVPKKSKKQESEPDITIEAPKVKAPRAKKATATKDFDETEEEAISWWRDGRLTKMAGLALVGSSFVMLVSFTSYLFTVADDQSEVLGRAATALFDNTVHVNNTFGRLGAILAHFFVHNLFGIASYLFCVMSFVIGFNWVVQQQVFRAWRISLYSLLGAIWLSAALALANRLIYPASLISWGGAFGDYLTGVDGQVTGLLHTVGTGLALGIVALCAWIWVYNTQFGFLIGQKRKVVAGEDSFAMADAGTGVAATASSFRDESENIFGKDNLADLQQSVAAHTDELTTAEIDLDDDDDGIMLSTAAMTTPPFEVADPYALEIAQGIEEDTTAPEDLPLDIIQPVAEPVANTPVAGLMTKFDPTLDLSNYKLPTLDLLDEHGNEKIRLDQEELERNKNQIISTLNNYQIEISKIKATVGPTVTLYEIVPAPGVRISKIKNLEDDIALSLAALGIRIIAPIPGKGTIGIEVPNVNKEIVSMRSLLASDKFQNSTADLPICLGKTISNEILVADLAKMPHLLMAGATGQGKSVGINSILVSLLYKKHPSQLKFIMVDPKKVELSLYELLEKHFLAKLPGEADAIITDTRKVVTTLNALCIEMDQRYDLLKKAQVRNIKEYNHKFVSRTLNPQNGHKFLPYIVLVVDEFADLIMTAGKEVEMPIARLAQLARAIGIHLILATQRPSVNIITGTIKANFPARIAFKTTSKIDSRTILDTGGAEQLIGRGDMLLSQGSDMIRLQCGFVDTPEVERVRDFISNQQGYSEAFLLPEYIDPNEKGNGDDFIIEGVRDDLFEDAARVIVQNQMGSTSLIQRRLKLGYNRAGRLMDQLEEAGIVGENLGSKAREVKFKTEAELDQYLVKIR
jgi:DNA segregation ATPase FtsK/SpoIIIE, S-DNA-T family